MKHNPRFIYGNADEGGFFRPLHDADEIRRLSESIGSLKAVERMGLIDHQWALVRAGQSSVGSMLESGRRLRARIRRRRARDAAQTAVVHLRLPDSGRGPGLRRSDAGVASRPLRRALRAIGMEARRARARRDPIEARGPAGHRRRHRRVAPRPRSLAAPLRSLPHRPPLDRRESRRRGRFTRRAGGRRGAPPPFRRRGDDTLQAHRRSAASCSHWAISATRSSSTETLTFALTDAVATQDVAFLLMRLFRQPRSARTHLGIHGSNAGIASANGCPRTVCSYLIEMTPALLTNEYKREVAKFFRANPVPTGERDAASGP